MLEENEKHPYGYPAKSTIREHWVPFASSGLSPQARAALGVWFLPGPEILELPNYRKAGLEVKQLQGFEWLPERTSAIKRRCPGLPLYSGSLKTYLDDPEHRSDTPDWAYLDFDGSAFTFAKEIAGTVERLRLTVAPRLGISSIATRDRPMIAQCITAISLWCALFPHSFEAGIDMLRSGNEHLGLIQEEPAATYAICRELALLFLLMETFGKRAYGESDVAPAHRFSKVVETARRAVTDEIGDDVEARLGYPKAIPLAKNALTELQKVFADRQIPVHQNERLRFACKSGNGNKWHWTWFFRFSPLRERMPLMQWAENLFLRHPPLHVVDFTGTVIGNRRQGVCRFCRQERDEQDG